MFNRRKFIVKFNWYLKDDWVGYNHHFSHQENEYIKVEVSKRIQIDYLNPTCIITGGLGIYYRRDLHLDDLREFPPLGTSIEQQETIKSVDDSYLIYNIILENINFDKGIMIVHVTGSNPERENDYNRYVLDLLFEKEYVNNYMMGLDDYFSNDNHHFRCPGVSYEEVEDSVR
jgi:hypothetical protein